MFRVFPGLLPHSWSVVSQVFRAMRAVQGRSHVLGDDTSQLHLRFASEVPLVFRSLSSPFLARERLTCRSLALCIVPPKRSVAPVVFSASPVLPRV